MYPDEDLDRLAAERDAWRELAEALEEGVEEIHDGRGIENPSLMSVPIRVRVRAARAAVEALRGS